jgi:1,4-dihydroxy-2-naphthoate octaprenyltransferase
MMNTTAKALIKLARPHLFTGTLILYFTGSSLAAMMGYPFDVPRFLLGLGIVSTALLSMSYSNNYFDTDVDQLSTPTSFSGGGGTLLQDKKLGHLVKRISIASFLLSLTLAVVFIILFSYSFLFFLYVVTGNILAWFYTAPPLKFSYRGLGELATMVAIGLMIPGLGYYVLARTIDLPLVLLSIPLMLYMAIFIISAEIPDRQGDTLGKKKTFVVRTSIHAGHMANALLALLAAVYFFMLAFTGVLKVPVNFFILAVLSLIPFVFGLFSFWKHFTTSQIHLKVINANVSSVVIFILLLNVYFGVLTFL